MILSLLNQKAISQFFVEIVSVNSANSDNPPHPPFTGRETFPASPEKGRLGGVLENPERSGFFDGHGRPPVILAVSRISLRSNFIILAMLDAASMTKAEWGNLFGPSFIHSFI